jgi:hypothetical protein
VSEKRQFIVRVDGEITDEVREALTREAHGLDTPVSERIYPLPERGESRWLEPTLDAQGMPFFRVVVTAETEEQAKARVEDFFSAIPHLAVGESYARPQGEITKGDYEAIEKRAIEHFVVELMTGLAAEGERLSRIVLGRDDPS